jgi:hypothetical protein
VVRDLGGGIEARSWSLAVSIALGATSMSDINLLAHQVGVFSAPPSQATVRRCLNGLDTGGAG